MHIRLLPELENKSQWISFCQREQPYCFVAAPNTLVDFQTSYLQITLLDNVRHGQQALKYSLGARYTVEPAWSLIKACNWQLSEVVKGLNQLDFGSNVRDNSLAGIHTDLTVRKFYAKEREIISPLLLGEQPALSEPPEHWSGEELTKLLVHKQLDDLRAEPFRKAEKQPANQLLSQLRCQVLQQPTLWRGHLHHDRLYLFYNKQPQASLIPNYQPPQPRLVTAKSAFNEPKTKSKQTLAARLKGANRQMSIPQR